jgi:zinc protease
MRRLTALVLTVLLLGLAPLRAAEISEFTLENGLHVVVIEDMRAPAVTHMMWYHVGAADEPAGKSGIAHFLEHLMFKGTDTRAPGEFSAVVEANGGRDNAFTSWDYTGYFQRVAADRLGLMMEMEADRMANLSFTDAEWLPERDVILEERGQVLESRPGAVFNEAMRAAQFVNHRYGIPIIGWRHEMEGLTGDDAMDFYARHYGPNNAVLVVAGAATADEVRALAETHYGPIPPNPAILPRVRVQEPPQLAERRVMREDARVSQPYVLRSYLAPVRRSGDQAEAAALAVLAELLGGSDRTSFMADRLLLGDDPVALSAGAWYSGQALDYGTFGVSIVPAEGVSLAEAEAALDDTIAAFIEEGPDPARFETVQMRIRASEIYALDNAQGLARRYGAALTTGLTVQDVQDWPDLLMAVTPEDVQAAAERIFDRKAAVTGWLKGPDDVAAARRGAPGVDLSLEEISQ